MWHEARRQEKKIRGLMVDYKKRAERRREFYEKIKLDPTQFLRVYGRPYKIHLDQAVAMAAESPQSQMPWQGHRDNMIDRFDVRAHLDTIPEPKNTEPIKLNRGEEDEERQTNYERYRTLVENESAGLTEEQALHQIYIDEQFGPPDRSAEEEKKKLADKKVAIGYTYEDDAQDEEKVKEEEEDEEESDESSDTDVETADLDVTLDVDELTPEQMKLINQCAEMYGMKHDDFIRLLRKDKEELEALRQAKLLEEEKAQFAGRKSRRERRAFKDKRLQGRRVSPPSYAARDSPKYEPYKRSSSSSSRSRSRSPENVGKVMFITSFGDESDHEEKTVVHGPSLPSSHQQQSRTHSDKSDSKRQSCVRKSSSRRHRSDRTRSRSRSRSWNRSSRRRRSSSRSPTYSRSRRYSRERRSSRDRRPANSYSRLSPRKYGDSRRRSYVDRYRPRSRSRSPRRRRSRSRSRSSSRSSRSRSSRSSSHSSSSSRSRSRSKSKSRSRSESRSKSRTPPRVTSSQPFKKYRRKSLSASDVSSDEENKKNGSSQSKRPVQPLVFSKTAALTQMKLTPQERLKRRMQAQLNRQYKADKKAETMRLTKAEQERLDREEDLRSRAMEMRRREREKRHKELEERERNVHYSSDSDSSRSPSPRRSTRNRSLTRSRSVSRSRSRSRSQSASPERGLVSY